MRSFRQTTMILVMLLAILAVDAVGQDDVLSGIFIRNSNEAADTTTGPHGGKVIDRGPLGYEMVMDPDGVRIFITDSTGNAVDLKGITGTCQMIRGLRDSDHVDLLEKKDSKKKYLRLGTVTTERGRLLFAPYDFSLVADGAARVRVDLAGIPVAAAPEVTFAAPFVMSRLRGWSCRGHENRIFLKYRDYPLCDKEYLDDAPFLFQCPNHENSRDHKSSTCPLCGATRIPIRQSATVDPSELGRPTREIK